MTASSCPSAVARRSQNCATQFDSAAAEDKSKITRNSRRNTIFNIVLGHKNKGWRAPSYCERQISIKDLAAMDILTPTIVYAKRGTEGTIKFQTRAYRFHVHRCTQRQPKERSTVLTQRGNGMKAKFRLVGQPTPHYPKGRKAIVSFEVPRTARRGGILLRFFFKAPENKNNILYIANLLRLICNSQGSVWQSMRTSPNLCRFVASPLRFCLHGPRA